MGAVATFCILLGHSVSVLSTEDTIDASGSQELFHSVSVWAAAAHRLSFSGKREQFLFGDVRLICLALLFPGIGLSTCLCPCACMVRSIKETRILQWGIASCCLCVRVACMSYGIMPVDNKHCRMHAPAAAAPDWLTLRKAHRKPTPFTIQQQSVIVLFVGLPLQAHLHTCMQCHHCILDIQQISFISYALRPWLALNCLGMLHLTLLQVQLNRLHQHTMWT